MLFLSQEVSAHNEDTREHNSVPLTSSSSSAPVLSSNIEEDEIDVFLSKQEGLIHRERDPQLWVLYFFSNIDGWSTKRMLLKYIFCELMEFQFIWQVSSQPKQQVHSLFPTWGRYSRTSIIRTRRDLTKKSG